MLITLIAGARPNFMKIAPLIKAIQAAAEAGKKAEKAKVATGKTPVPASRPLVPAPAVKK